ncbi:MULTISPECIES: bifunctional 2-polyprenyl-6-hydroxyphenol methylase/3-demethylubiquinol 3-O-methyltransferase UbiG [unclassified Mycolicibacterium]|uniref:class I SAM-dependent methyltransferase n=1 Tax=unclassified Mycolicibacterium TaxID=2636767 RepID=UPI00192E622B|nr:MULTISPECIES: class I SAM-dependent methyltransferase [unclassified Mycolicibacterium]
MNERNGEFFSAETERQLDERVTNTARRHGIEVPGLDQAFWEQRWESVRRTTKGRSAVPNWTLTGAAEQLPPGVALDAGCGEGSDAIWLASHGWMVSAVDFIASALQCGRVHAERTGAEVARRINWEHADLSVWVPPEGAFDLVSAHYLHGISQREVLFRRLAAAVRPGGALLIVGHHPSNADIAGGQMPEAVFFSTADVVKVLDESWSLVTVDDNVPQREITDHDGRLRTLRSALVWAQRL